MGRTTQPNDTDDLDAQNPLDDVKEIPYQTEAVPNYIFEGLEKQNEQALKDIIGYCLHRLNNDESLGVSVTEHDEEAYKGTSGTDGWIFKRKIVCGDKSCHCYDSEANMHGGYWYVVTKDGDGSYNWDYRGKERPPELTDDDNNYTKQK